MTESGPRPVQVLSPASMCLTASILPWASLSKRPDCSISLRDTVKAAARQRPSNSVAPIRNSRASFPMPWRATRRFNRSLPEPWRPGVRGGLESNLKWNVAWFRADNRNDILFVASEQTGFGYFKNFGKTLRQGLEIDVNSRIWRVNLGGGYTFLDATFQSEEEVNGTGNSTNEEAEDGIPGVDGAIEIEPGNHIPLIPRHMFKAYADIQVTSRFLVISGWSPSQVLMPAATKTTCTTRMGHIISVPDNRPATRLSTSEPAIKSTAMWNCLFRSTICLTGNTTRRRNSVQRDSRIRASYIARPFPAINGEFPVQQTTFFAPGAPIGAWGGIRLRF